MEPKSATGSDGFLFGSCPNNPDFDPEPQKPSTANLLLGIQDSCIQLHVFRYTTRAYVICIPAHVRTSTWHTVTPPQISKPLYYSGRLMFGWQPG
ncbi:hypothetical protein P692DRAFT_20833120 [Suillus brevipes Sb2]|nr:hypothetical protein P692DRAFT_20833120 [Suillus brevipes Sb2]